MASPRSESLEVADYLGVLHRRWWIVVVAVVIGAVIGAAYVKVAPKTYSASVLIEVAALPNNANAVAGRTGGNVNMDNEAQVLASVAVSSIAAKTLHTSITPANLIKNISVTVPPNTTFLQVKCGMSTAREAAACANAFGNAYLAQRRDTVESGITSEVGEDNRRITSLTDRVASLKAKLSRIKGGPTTAHVRVGLALSQAQTQLAGAEAENEKLVPFLQDLNLPGNNSVGQVVTPASLPTSPSSPRQLLVLPSGVLAGLLIGLLIAFVVDLRDRRIHSARDVERYLDVPVLVNLAAGKSRLQPVLASPRTRTGQAFTELSQYVAASLGDGRHVLFVAGTSAGSGCSVMTANLAATLARTRSGVMLICADPGGTVTPALLEVSDDRGLAEILAGSASPGEVIRRVPGEPGLEVITPGLDVSAGLLNLQYEASRRLLSELRRDYHYVIVEVQSVGEDSSAFALAEFADAAVMAVEVSMTTRPGAAECLRRLDRLRTSVLGAVVLPKPDGKPARPLPQISSGRVPAQRPLTGPAERERRHGGGPAASGGLRDLGLRESPARDPGARETRESGPRESREPGPRESSARESLPRGMSRGPAANGAGAHGAAKSPKSTTGNGRGASQSPWNSSPLSFDPLGSDPIMSDSLLPDPHPRSPRPAASDPLSSSPRSAKSDPLSPASRPAKSDPLAPSSRPAKSDPLSPSPRPAKSDPLAPSPRPAKSDPLSPSSRPSGSTSSAPDPASPASADPLLADPLTSGSRSSAARHSASADKSAED
jgi:capsular polysaccharide biosynthesis protein/Mrp family chromosome partitioning ATPase